MNEFIKKIDIACRILYGQKKQYLAEYIECNKRSLENIAAGKPYVLCTYYFPSEIAAMYDAEYIYIERIVGIAVSCGMVGRLEKDVLPNTICSYHKAFWELLERKVLPLPVMILGLAYPCMDARILCEKLHSLYGIPLIRIGDWDRKYPMKGEKKEPDYGGVLRDCCNVLHKYFIQKQTIEETVEYANQAAALKKQIDEARIQCPGILCSDEILKIFTVENLYGRKEAICVLRKLLTYIGERKKQYTNSEKIRFFWMGLIPLYDNNMLSYIENRYDCQFVYEEMWMFGDYHLEAPTFYDDMDKKIRGSLFYNLDERICRLIDKMEKLDVKTAIHFSQAHCSFLPPQIKEIERALGKKNMTLYHLGADVVKGHFLREKLEKVVISCKEREGG